MVTKRPPRAFCFTIFRANRIVDQTGFDGDGPGAQNPSTAFRNEQQLIKISSSRSSSKILLGMCFFFMF